MNRADFQMALGQANELGDTLMKNRVLEQQRTERQQLLEQRDRFQTQDDATRNRGITEQAAWRTDQNAQRTRAEAEQGEVQAFSAGFKANMDGTMDDAGREKFNQWLAAHPQFNGIRVVAPPAPKAGPENVSPQLRQLQELKSLQAAVAAATTPQEKQQAEADLVEFKALLPGKQGDGNWQTISETTLAATEQAEVPEVPPTPGNFLGFGAKPGKPGKPGTPNIPARTRTWRGPMFPTATTATTGPTPVAGQKMTPAIAITYLKKYGNRKAAEAAAKQDGYAW